MNRFHAHSGCRVLAALCFAVLLAACDQSDQSGQTGQATADSEQDDGKPITAMAALDRQIDSGKMTSVEAIVAALQVLIGERTEKEVFGPDTPPLREGTAIIRRAQAYLKTGPDEKHKAEIRRILNILVPPGKNWKGARFRKSRSSAKPTARCLPAWRALHGTQFLGSSARRMRLGTGIWSADHCEWAAIFTLSSIREPGSATPIVSIRWTTSSRL